MQGSPFAGTTFSELPSTTAFDQSQHTTERRNQGPTPKLHGWRTPPPTQPPASRCRNTSTHGNSAQTTRAWKEYRYAGCLCPACMFVVQSNSLLRARRESTLTFGVDPATLREGLGLTAIGVSTAFALLIVLYAGVWVVGRFLGPKRTEPDASDSTSLDSRDKALAAAVAVSVLREIQDNSAVLPPSSSDNQLLPQR